MMLEDDATNNGVASIGLLLHGAAYQGPLVVRLDSVHRFGGGQLVYNFNTGAPPLARSGTKPLITDGERALCGII